MRRQVFVGPRLEDGVHEVQGGDVRRWARSLGLHESNMDEHVVSSSSDHKCDGWRLIERLRWVQHVEHNEWLLPALGTAESFVASCTRATDDRRKIANQKATRMLLGAYGKYTNGKPYCCWRLKCMTPSEAEARIKCMVQIQARGMDALSLASSRLASGQVSAHPHFIGQHVRM